MFCIYHQAHADSTYCIPYMVCLKLSSLHGDNNTGVHIIFFFFHSGRMLKTTITLTLNLNVLVKNYFPFTS